MNVIPPVTSSIFPDMRAAMRQALDPVSFSREILAFEPDPWQADLLRLDHKPALVCCSRQSGKSTTLTLLIAPTQRQSTELLAKASGFLRRIPGAELDNESTVTIRFAGGSRLVSLPGTDADRIRGFSSPALVIIDEAAFVSDALYYAIRPMLAVGGGRLIAMSTPNGRVGWFSDAWFHDAEDDWHRIKITADMCPRISAAFLAGERRKMGDRMFRQEYMCEFISAEDQLFDSQDIEQAFDDNVSVMNIRSGL
jgi:hypothetical protein